RPLDQRYLDAVHMRGKLPVDASELPRFVQTLSASGREISLAEAGIPLDGAGAVKAAYHSEIRFLDQALGRFFDALDHSGVGDDAVVVLTADHGEAFFEHGLMEHGLLYDENLRIPLIIRAPGRLGAGKRIPQQVSTIDVAPTILDLVGLPIPAGMEGRSLVPLVGGEEEADRDFYSLVLGNGLSFQAGGRYKLIVRAALGQENFGINELFDLVEDPLEQRNLLAEGIEIPEPMHRQMRRTIAQFPGVHIDFGALADQTYELELAAGRGYRDRVYAFDTHRVGPLAE
ncbi:MAG: sulfatase-like hydrolase/transferase, partial [bacterium]|nr:sulfatase-like hydrolase/transferase [bacterium]